MEDLVNSVSKLSEPLIDLFFSMFAVAKECFKHPRHDRFEECEVQFGCFKKRMEALVETD